MIRDDPKWNDHACAMPISVFNNKRFIYHKSNSERNGFLFTCSI